MALLETERVDDIDAVEADTGRCPVIQLSDWRSLRLGTPSAAATATKRAIDIVVAFVGLVLALPALPFVALAIKLDSPGPVFCRLSRVGLNGEAFWLWKVRTMTADAHTGPVWTTSDDPRITRVGRFLRRTHLDEIPQLYNVLRGEMSLVGPRPDDAGSERELGERYPFYALRHAVRPGIAGWAAVNNGYVDAEDAALLRFEYDVYYVRNRSLALDARILFRSALHAATLRGR